MTRTLAQLCAAIFINDVEPRRKKYGRYPPMEFVGLLSRLEFEGAITRKKLREYLDIYYVGED